MARDGHEQGIGKRTEIKPKGIFFLKKKRIRGQQPTLDHLSLNVAWDEGVDPDLKTAQFLGEGGGEAWGFSVFQSVKVYAQIPLVGYSIVTAGQERGVSPRRPALLAA